MKASPPLRLTIVTAHYHPDVAATGQLLTELAEDLARGGCQVTIYTTHPTFGPRGRTAGFEIREGVRIHRVFSTRFDKNRKLGRAFNAGTFFLAAFWALLFDRNSGPLMIVSNPPFLAFAGYALRKLQGRRYIYLVHDVFPDLAVALGVLAPDGWVRKLWDRANRLIVGHASRIIVLGESMKRIMLGKADSRTCDPSRFQVIPNWADEHFIRPLPRERNEFLRQHGLLDSFVVLYSGNMGLGHSLEMVIEAADRLRNRNMVFLFIGDGGKRRKLQNMAESLRLENVRFLPYQPREILPQSLTCGDVSLVALEKGIEGIQMPSKLYTIMASGCPAIALVEEGSEISRTLEQARCGHSVAPGDVDGLIAVLDTYDADREACAREGRAGRAYFEAHFTRARAIREYLEVTRAVQ